MKAMLLAAGEGRRLRPLTERMPKPMIPVRGKPILAHNIGLLASYDIKEIAINLHHCPEIVESYFGNGSRFGVQITYSHESQLLGTAGAVRKLAPFFGRSAFLVLYGDNLVHCDLTKLAAFHREHEAVLTVALHCREDVAQSGVAELNEDDRILRFVEKPSAGQISSQWVNAGVLVCEPSVLDLIPSDTHYDFGKGVIPDLLEMKKRVFGYRMSGEERIDWVDTPEDLGRVGGVKQLW